MNKYVYPPSDGLDRARPIFLNFNGKLALNFSFFFVYVVINTKASTALMKHDCTLLVGKLNYVEYEFVFVLKVVQLKNNLK